MTQSKFGSFFESILGALMAAPSATILHWYMLELWGNDFDNPTLKGMFVSITWVSFFIHSITWKFIFRRIFERYGLEPKTLILRLRGNNYGT